MTPKTDDPKKNPAVPPMDTGKNCYLIFKFMFMMCIIIPKKSVKVKITSRWYLKTGYFSTVTKAPVVLRNFFDEKQIQCKKLQYLSQKKSFE